MAAKDAEMPNYTALREEADKIAKHLQTLRKDIEGLTSAVAEAGGNQADRAKDGANEVLAQPKMP